MDKFWNRKSNVHPSSLLLTIIQMAGVGLILNYKLRKNCPKNYSFVERSQSSAYEDLLKTFLSYCRNNQNLKVKVFYYQTYSIVFFTSALNVNSQTFFFFHLRIVGRNQIFWICSFISNLKSVIQFYISAYEIVHFFLVVWQYRRSVILNSISRS